MRQWQEDQLQEILTVKCEKRVFDAVRKFAKDLEFEYCAYGLRTSLPASRPEVVMLNNYPSQWQARYKNENYLAVDPTVRHAAVSSLPIVWSDDLFIPARELWEEARSFGLRFGWAQSNRNVSGVAGMLTLARSEEPLTRLELGNKELQMAWLTQIAHLAMSQSIMRRLLPEKEVKLTAREIAVMRWTADGKTSIEISEILGISERTINFHITNTVSKLGVANKMAAAVKVAVLGLI